MVIGSLSIVLPVARQMPSKETIGALLADAVQNIRENMVPAQDKPVIGEPIQRRARAADGSRL
jgi:hypothetical protein